MHLFVYRTVKLYTIIRNYVIIRIKYGYISWFHIMEKSWSAELRVHKLWISIKQMDTQKTVKRHLQMHILSLIWIWPIHCSRNCNRICLYKLLKLFQIQYIFPLLQYILFVHGKDATNLYRIVCKFSLQQVAAPCPIEGTHWCMNGNLAVLTNELKASTVFHPINWAVVRTCWWSGWMICQYFEWTWHFCLFSCAFADVTYNNIRSRPVELSMNERYLWPMYTYCSTGMKQSNWTEINIKSKSKYKMEYISISI